MIPIRIGATLLVFLGLVTRTQQAERDRLSALDPALQAGISRLLTVKSDAEMRAALDALEARAGAEHGLLVPQLFFYLELAPDTREAMLPGFVLAELRIPPAHVIQALVPLLESADSERRRALANVLCEYEDHSIERGASFTVYRRLLDQGLPLGLVRHLYETDPEAALLALTRAEVSEADELRALLWAWHEIGDLRWKLRLGFLARDQLASADPDALKQLAALAHHPRWWARLYAAQVAREEPALLPAAERAALTRDEHPLVREFATVPPGDAR